MKIFSSYDIEADVVDISISNPTPAITRSDEKDERIQWCYALDDGNPCGVTLRDYRHIPSSYLQEQLIAKLKIPMETVLDTIADLEIIRDVLMEK